MMKTVRVPLFAVLITLLLLSACAKSDAPADTMEAYWKAMAAKDSATLGSLSCKDYEAQTLSTLDSFSAVDLSLKDITCSTTSNSGSSAEVTCNGSLVASYGSEDSSFDLSVYTYELSLEGGNWLMCGEK
jgi:hypothetical protein